MKFFIILITTTVIVHVSNGQSPYSDSGLLCLTSDCEPRNLQERGSTRLPEVTVTVEEPGEALSSVFFTKGGGSFTFDILKPGHYPTYRVDFGVPGVGHFNGTYHNLRIKEKDRWGGVWSYGSYSVASTNFQTVLELDNLANYFGVSITSADVSNQVVFYENDKKIYHWFAQDYLNSLRARDPRYIGNPFADNTGNELTFRLNFYFNYKGYNKVKFTTHDRATFLLETDNHTAGIFACQSGFLIVGGPPTPLCSNGFP